MGSPWSRSSASASGVPRNQRSGAPPSTRGATRRLVLRGNRDDVRDRGVRSVVVGSWELGVEVESERLTRVCASTARTVRTPYGVGRFRYRTISIHIHFRYMFFGTSSLGTSNVNIGTVTFGTYEISVQSTSVQ